MLQGMWSKGEHSYCCWECKLVQSPWKSRWQILIKLGIYFLNIQLQHSGIYQKKSPKYHKYICSTTFIATLFIIIQQKMWYIYTLENFSALINNDIWKLADFDGISKNHPARSNLDPEKQMWYILTKTWVLALKCNPATTHTSRVGNYNEGLNCGINESHFEGGI